MDDKNGFVISNHDRVLRAWEDSTALVAAFQRNSHEMEHDDAQLATLFASFAEDEALHAAALRERLLRG